MGRKTNLVRRLETLYAQKEEVERQIRAAYQESLDAAEADKVCHDWCARTLARDDRARYIQYPITVHGIHRKDIPVVRESVLHPNTKWVSVRPVGDEHGGRTYLGILLGEIAWSVSCRFSPDGILSVKHAGHNPAIYVPDLHEIIWGMRSWWRAIDGPDGLRAITDVDITNVWYVRALRELEGRK